MILVINLAFGSTAFAEIKEERSRICRKGKNQHCQTRHGQRGESAD